MSRYGGAASVGHIIKEDYGYGPPPQRSNVRRNVAIGGVGAAGLGLHQVLGANKVSEIAPARAAAAAGNVAAARTRLDQAMSHAARMEAGNIWGKRTGRWLNTGKRREANRRLEAAHVEHERAKMASRINNNLATPEGIAMRAKSMRKVGAGLMIGGTLATAAALKRRNEPVAKTSLADVSKTITQARYGANAEMGRRWRGEEKKNGRARDVALGGAALGTGGGIAALGAASRRPKTMKDRSIALNEIANTKATAANTAIAEHTTAAGRFGAAEQAARGGNTTLLRRMRAQEGTKHRIMSQPHNYGTGPRHGSDFVRHLENKAEAARRTAESSRTEALAARAAHTEHGPQLAANRLARAKAGRWIKGGGALAAIGGATAIGAGIKAEKDRRTWGRHVRKDLKEDLEGNTRVSREMEDLKSIKRRLKTLPEEDKFALEQKVKGNIRMKEGKEDRDDKRKVKRRLKELPKEDKFALQQDLHARPIEMSKALDPKKMKNLGISAMGSGGVLPKRQLGPKPTSLLAMTPEQRAAWQAKTEAKMKRIKGR